MAHNPHSINKSKTKTFRTTYMSRFLARCAILIGAILLFFIDPGQFDIMLGLNFFRGPSLFHLLWAAWMFDMIMQLIPSSGYWPLGSTKYFGSKFVPLTKRINLRHIRQILTKEQLARLLNKDNILEYINKVPIARYINRKRLVAFVKQSTKDAYYIAIIWILMVVGFAFAYRYTPMNHRIIMLISIGFYLSDVICVLFWCPFRVFFMKNRCCTTCRIFNWDHLMMFSPFLFIPGFFTWTLSGMAVLIFVAWEVSFFLHPERFWDESNDALVCRNCTDELCGKRLGDYLPEEKKTA